MTPTNQMDPSQWASASGLSVNLERHSNSGLDTGRPRAPIGALRNRGAIQSNAVTRTNHFPEIDVTKIVQPKKDVKEGSYSLKRMLRDSGFANLNMLTGALVVIGLSLAAHFLLKTSPDKRPNGFSLDDINRILTANSSISLMDLRNMMVANQTDPQWNATQSMVKSLGGGAASTSGFTLDSFIVLAALGGLFTVGFLYRTSQADAIIKAQRDSLITAGDNNKQRWKEIKPYLPYIEPYIAASMRASYKSIKRLVKAGKAEDVATGKTNPALVDLVRNNHDRNILYNHQRAYIKRQIHQWLESRSKDIYPFINNHVKTYPRHIREECKDAYLAIFSRTPEFKETMEGFEVFKNIKIEFPRPRKAHINTKACFALIGKNGGTGKEYFLEGLAPFNMQPGVGRIPLKYRGGANEIFPKDWSALEQTSFPTNIRDLLGIVLQIIFSLKDKADPSVGINLPIYFPEVDIKDPTVLEVFKILMDPPQVLLDWMTMNSKYDISNLTIFISANVDEIDGPLETRLLHVIKFDYSSMEAQSVVAEKRYKEMSKFFVDTLSNGQEIISGQAGKDYVDFMENIALPALLEKMATKIHGARPKYSESLTTWVGSYFDEYKNLPDLPALDDYLNRRFKGREDLYKVIDTPLNEIEQGEPARYRLPIKEWEAMEKEK